MLGYKSRSCRVGACQKHKLNAGIDRQPNAQASRVIGNHTQPVEAGQEATQRVNEFDDPLRLLGRPRIDRAKSFIFIFLPEIRVDRPEPCSIPC